MNVTNAVDQLKARSIPGKGTEMAAYHKVDRAYLGVANPDIDDLSKAWRNDLSLDDRLQLADDLWRTNVHEARVASAKLLTQARIRPDDGPAWELIKSWVPDFDAWAIADHVAIAGQKRLVWVPTRIEDIEPWTTSDHMWTKRAALVMTLQWARIRDPKPTDLGIRERVLGWAAIYVEDKEWFIQKSVGWWLRDLSKKDPARVTKFLDDHGDKMKNFVRKEASKYL